MRTATLVLVAAVATATAASPAMATSKKKPISKTYTATAPAPDPTNTAGMGYSVCAMTVPNSFDKQEFKAPAAGKLKVEVDGIIGDWDLLVIDSKGFEAGSSGSGGYGTPVSPSTESTSVKIKRAGTYSIVACNWAGAPTATVKYTFTYA